MKLIIDIPEEMISLIKDKSVECFNVIHYGQVLDAIYNGTPIPDNATNDDVLKALFDERGYMGIHDRMMHTKWLFAKYKGE